MLYYFNKIKAEQKVHLRKLNLKQQWDNQLQQRCRIRWCHV